MAKRIIALDFDNTLCNTGELKSVLAQSLQRLGLPKLRPPQFHETYADACALSPAGYAMDNHAKLIAGLVDRAEDEPFVRRITDQFRLALASNMKRLLAKDAIAFIKAANEIGEARILTHGQHDWQWAKIKACGLLDHIDRSKLIITEDPLGKEEEILRMLEEERGKLVYINDRFDENERIAASEFIPEYTLGEQFLLLEMQRPWEDEPRRDSNQDVVHDLGAETLARIKAFYGLE